VFDALAQVDELGYGMVLPTFEEMELGTPEVIRNGNNYGVKFKATAPALHIVKVDVEAEVTPTIGSEQQSEELVAGILSDMEKDRNSIWDKDFFGYSLSSFLTKGINDKLMSVPGDAQLKMRKTMGRIVNEGKGGMICILL
jgi:stage IV sporulation protein A